MNLHDENCVFLILQKSIFMGFGFKYPITDILKFEEQIIECH